MSTTITETLLDGAGLAARDDRPGIFIRLGKAARAAAHRFEDRRTVSRLSRLDARLIRDMGFEPDMIYGAVEGSWDDHALRR
ncbi:MAG: hypothetical protein KIS96_11140 [Bauldia sp.]|nr:hypothetical protein [Bauldia sp.]